MADEPWLLKEDGYLNVDSKLKQIVYHPALNVILICTNLEIVHVLDVNSGVVLQSSRLSAQENSKVTCRYLTGQDRILFCDGYGIGVRSDYNGVLLLDTILQKPVASPRDIIKIELLLSEAILLKQNLILMSQFVIDQQSEVINELCDKIAEAQKQTKKGIKAQKWNTVCLELPLDSLKRVAEITVTEFALKNQHVPELAVAAAVQERLNELLNDPPTANDRSAMASEARRRETFSRWPHMDYKWALPDQMAQAGFYHQPNSSGDDRAMCFTCTVCLVCWERTDEPWSEHERHSPNCPFVMGEYTQNVPLSVTYATAPALDATYRGSPVSIVGTSGVPNLITTANADGLVTVYDVSGKLKRTHSFYVTQYDSHIVECCMQEFGHDYLWSNLEEGRSVTITSLSVVGDRKSTSQVNLQKKGKFGARSLNPVSRDTSSQEPAKFTSMEELNNPTEPKPKADRVRPVVICGLTIKGRLISTNGPSTIDEPGPDSQMIIEDLNVKNCDSSTCLCLVVYDFQYTKDVEREEAPPKKTSSSKPLSNIVISMMDMDYSLMDASNSSEAMTFINDMNFQALKMLKQTESNNYQNLIPGESDDIFLPPAASNPQVSGTRVLVVEEGEEPDASSSVITAPNYQLMNGQLSSPTEGPNSTNSATEKSISDHIIDLKSSKNKKLNYSHAVQCVALPSQYKNDKDLEIFSMTPTRDGGHVLVVVRSVSGAGRSVLLLYALSVGVGGSVVKLSEKPAVVRELPSGQCPVEVSVIPSVDKVVGQNSTQDGNSAGSKPVVDGAAVIVCVDGEVRIFELATFKPTRIARLDAEKFVSAVYCNSLERLCAATAKGSLHFYALNEVDNDFTDEHEDEDYLSSLSSTEVPAASSRGPEPVPEGVSHCFQEMCSGTASGTCSSTTGIGTTGIGTGTGIGIGTGSGTSALLGLADLRHLHSLCAFEPLSAGYCVVVPPCWSEMQQAQRQRRHPQYLTGDEHHTRTWRLQTDTTTWDEHIFELTLPWPVNIGHMDVHFSLHGQHSNPPHVEITLLRQNTSGIGHRRTEVHFQVDEAVSFECLQRNQNPVTSREYLRSHNADILAGPINLADCLDMSEQNGCVTLTSPKLFKANTRTILLHIKALCDPSKEHSNIRKEFKIKRDVTATPANVSTSTQTGGVTTNKAEYYMGCDCLHEISITMYKARNVESAEKIQRSAMLESNVFLATLLRTVMDCSSVQRQSMAFDVIIWVSSIRLARNRNSNGEAPAHQLECLRTIELGLESMFKQCLLSSGRSIAHKCVKLVVICSDGAKNISESIGHQFDNKVLQALLQCLPEICKVWSAGALHWLVVLILRVTRENNHQLLANQCINLLRQIAHELHTRTNPYHLLLRSRFGLFGTPLEPELFDIDPPAPAKSSSIPVTYASVVTGDQATHSTFQNTFVFNESSLDPKEVFVSPSNETKVRLKSMAPNKHMRGLLETEPLHFACVAASDGTRVERFDPTVPPVNMSGLFGPVTVHAPHSQQNTGTKKADSDDIKDKENVALTELDITLEPTSNTSIDTYPKELTQLLLNADIQKVNPHDWPILTNKLGGYILDGLEMTIDDSDLCSSSDPSNNNNGTSSGTKGPAWGRPDHIELLSPQLAQCSLQQLLVAPPQQVMVVERMQSGARRFVTLDFGAPVLLTDVIIPACHDLVSLSLDLWLRGEDTDAVRLVLATDIGSKTLVLSDLQPPPICRYIKITTIGRYGMSTTRCKIPIGNFYGHIIVLPDEIPPDGDPLTTPCLNASDIDNQMNLLAMLLEDVSCRYSLACSRLKDLLHPLFTSDIPNSVHMAAYMSIVKDTIDQCAVSADNIKVFTAYQEAMMYQRQLNVVQGVIHRIEKTTGAQPSSCTHNKGLEESCTDKLRVISENLLDILLSLQTDLSSSIDRQTCQQLFRGLCVAQAPRLQMLTATLLVRTCGKQSYWGNFIADTLAQMFSSSYTMLFPQDRVFVLLTYLGRKTPERNIVLDATLRILAEVLTSLSRPQDTLLAVSTDLSLLGWILLYLSLQLDNTSKSDNNSARRWNWVTGDNSARTPDTGVCTGSHRRKVHRRFIHYKQQIDQLDWTKKAVQASTQVQALSALSSQAASLSSKLEAALKQQEHVFKRIKQISSKQKEIAASKQDGSSKHNRSASARDSNEATSSGTQITQILDAEHCLAVTRGIVTLLLAMDHSCSADMFLLACKVVARLVTMSRLSICQLFTVEQLQKLMRQCVRGDHPWTQHALACLLQDMLDVTIGNSNGNGNGNGGIQSATTSATTIDDPFEASTANTSTDMDTDSQPAGPSWGATDSEMFESFSMDENIIPEKIQAKSNSNTLPSVFESDDSELDDFLDDILERGRSLLRRNGATKSTVSNGSISSAMDARLELGVESTAEIQLRRLTTLATCNLLQHLSTPISETATPQPPVAWPEHLLTPWSTPTLVGISNSEMLSTCFNTLFNEMQLQSSSSIEHTVRLWLTLNKTSHKGCFNPSVIPTICISAQSVNSLVSALVYSPSLSLRTWCVALQALTLICKMPNPAPAPVDWLEHSLNGMAGCLISHQEFVPMLLRLLSGSGLVFSDKGLAGPSVCRALHDLLLELLMRCDVITSGSTSGVRLKEHLLRLLYQLVQPSGPLASRQGPLDVQCKFLQSLLYLDYTDTNLGIVMCILESTGVLVSSYVSNVERIKCVNLGERNNGAANNFSGLFASVLGSDSSKQDRPVSWESLLIALLKLLTRLIQTPLPVDRNAPPSQEAMDTETVQTAQTDESKAERQQEANRESTVRVPCLADTVLQHHPSIMRLCHSLASCSGSSLAMLVGCAQQIGLTDFGEPTTVGDAVFQLLSVMTQKTSRPELILEPLVMFLRSATQLSEPLLWFMLQVLNTEDALKGFLNLDGVRVLAESMVRSGRSLSAVHHGTISLVMHHMAAAVASSVANRADPILSAPSFNKKVQQANFENSEALVNFAPLGSIRCHSGTAQPADVLIQSAVATHRRARTPQWCYHFYPDETHTDLTIRLPCAVLLREVQLQPHLSSLSTCPSAVALEVSNGSPDHLVPASPPLPTSGMTFIRLHLPVPEVVTHVLLRLYKPRDASNIGLSQIRLLGTSAFGGLAKSSSVSDVSDEETFSKFSLGWLRLLHHCFTLPQGNSELERLVVAAAASVPDLLVTCCGLLLVPTHIPTLYLPNLERVLCKLSLFDRQSGLNAIRMLLDSKSALSGSTHVLLSSKSQLALNSPATQSVCELLHQVCGHQDQDTSYRVSTLLEWLERTALHAISVNGNSDSCSPAFISCISSVLWSANESGVSYTLHNMVTTDLFNTVFKWTQATNGNVALKNSLDCLLCSLCYIKTELFPILLQRMGVLVPNLSTDRTASISDDRKDSRKDSSMTDDNKQKFENESEWYGRLIIGDLSQLNLTEPQLGTVAMVSRSPPVIQQLLDSGLPKLLIKAILEFCSSSKAEKVPMARLENVTAILKFLADVCAEQTMRDWLGSPDGSIFWLPLLQWLCKKPSSQFSKLRSESHAQLEEVCVRFLSKCCLCNRSNQRLLAKVLCEVISQQYSGISGFMRRLVLQLLLENEKVFVCVKADESVYKISPIPQPSAPLHPLHKRTHDRVLLQLSTNTTIGEILEQHIAFATTLKTDNKPKDNFGVAFTANAIAAAKEVWDIGIDGSDHISMAAGVTAKDKRAKDAKNQVLSSTPQLKKKRYTASEGMTGLTDTVGGRTVRCESLPEYPLPLGLTLAQLLALLEGQPGQPDIHLTISHSKDDRSSRSDADSLLQHRSIGNALQVFSSMGGLALLAQHLPAVYPEIVRPPSAEKPSTAEQTDADWVKVEGSDDIYEDLEDMPGSSTPSKNCSVITNVPPHSLTAFGLFLRLPGYAEVLLKDSKKALCLLRLVLGVTDDGEGGDIFLSPVADSLPTLPFEVLRQLYDTTPLGTDDGRLLRTISINIGVTHLLLACLAVFTHQIQPQPPSGPSTATASAAETAREAGNSRAEDKSQLYWAKGTGFGTGSTQQSWNVEQALLRQRSEEEHVTVLLQVLASYINPGGRAADELADVNVLPSAFEQQLSNSCLLPALSSYLRNDSVLDMARHIPLYRSVLQLLRAMALSQQLVTLLLPRPNGDTSKPPSIVSLLQKMKSCVDNYTCRLRFNKNSTNKFKFAKYSSEQQEETETDEGLALLMPDIQETANLVQQATSQILGSDENELSSRDATAIEQPLQQSLEQRYLDVMRRLQFDTYEMITESPDGYKFVVSYHFEGNVRSAGDQSQPARVKRLAQEAVTLATSLPLSYSSSVFVRCDTDRLDIMKVLITGPADTPYANGCFELDVYFPPDYPNAPMLINLETTGHHTVRFNPNLYNDGKVCLSVLNTWHGRPEEKWNAQTSSFLQVLVSIQSLILVPEPYFNEPGYERSRGTPSGTQSSREYNTNICQATVRWAMLEQIMNPCPCFKDVIHTHFWLKRHEILAQVEGWIADMEAQLAEKRTGRSSTKRTTISSLETFKKNYHQLREQLAKLTPPEGLEDLPENINVGVNAAAAANSTATAISTANSTANGCVNNDIDTDIDMEKMVSQVCE